MSGKRLPGNWSWVLFAIGVGCSLLSLIPVLGGMIEQAAGARWILSALTDDKIRMVAGFPCQSAALEDFEQVSLELAEDHLRRSLNWNGDQIQNERLLATVACATGNSDDAADYLQTYISYRPNNPWGQLQLQLLLSQSVKEGETHFLFTLRELTLTVDALIRAEQLDLAPQVLIFGYEQYPTEESLWWLWLRLGIAQEQHKDYADALRTYQTVLQLQRDEGITVFQPRFHLRAGRLFQMYIEPQDYEQALAHYQLALLDEEQLSSTERSSLHLYLAETYRAMSEKFTTEDVHTQYKLALALDPQSYWAYLSYGSFYLWTLRDPENAHMLIQQAIQLRPQAGFGYGHLGNVYRQQGRFAEAIQAYQQALTLNPDWAEAQHWLAETQQLNAEAQP